MTVWKHGNWAFCKTRGIDPPFKDGDIVEGGNYMQLFPDTEICKDVKDLTIRGGNFINCKPQPTWKIEGGNWCQKSWCSHEHPEWVKEGLPKCDEHCEHYKGEDWIEIEEEEFRKLKQKAEVNVRIQEQRDALGVVKQRFERRVPIYEDKVVRTGRPK